MEAVAEAVVESTVNLIATPTSHPTQDRYARVIEVSKRIRWDIERDVIRGRDFDFGKKFLPDGLSKLGDLSFLTPAEHRFLSQIQGRTYANMFGLVERFIGAKVIEIEQRPLARRPGRARGARSLHRRGTQAPGDVPPAGADGRAGMPAGYEFKPQPNDVAAAVLSKSTWAVLGTDAGHRALHSGALPRQHRARLRPVGAVEGRLPVPLEGGVAARNPRRTRVEARRRTHRRRRARPGRDRSHRAGGRGRRHRPGTGAG